MELAQDQAVAVRVDVDRNGVAVVHLAVQQQLGQLVADGLLDQPAQQAPLVQLVLQELLEQTVPRVQPATQALQVPQVLRV